MIQPSKHTVLIVEDMYLQYLYLKELLESKGLIVLQKNEDEAVDNYEDAIDIIDNKQPDLLVLDVKLKGKKDGLDIAAYANSKYTIPIIVFTSFTDKSLPAKRLGVEQTIIKVPEKYSKAQLESALMSCADAMEKQHKQKSIGKKFEVQFTSDENKKSDYQRSNPTSSVFIAWNTIYLVTANNKVKNNTLIITTINPNNNYTVRDTLSNLINLLPNYFIQLNRDTIINIHFVKSINKTAKSVLLLNSTEPFNNISKEILTALEIKLSKHFLH
jgi:DNA-binding LytR/AlgR family response regulator